MKLASFQITGRNSYGVVDGDSITDVGQHFGPAYPTLRAALAAGLLQGGAATASAPQLRLDEVTLRSPVTDPEKVICVGLNYRAHAAEGGFKIPTFPSIFGRFTNTLVPSGQALVKPPLWLRAGDQVEVDISSIGVLVNPVVDE